MRGGGSRGLYKRAEKRRGEHVAFHALRMPLHSDNPVFMWIVLYGFDHSIGGDRIDAQAVTQMPD